MFLEQRCPRLGRAGQEARAQAVAGIGGGIDLGGAQPLHRQGDAVEADSSPAICRSPPPGTAAPLRSPRRPAMLSPPQLVVAGSRAGWRSRPLPFLVSLRPVDQHPVAVVHLDQIRDLEGEQGPVACERSWASRKGTRRNRPRPNTGGEFASRSRGHWQSGEARATRLRDRMPFCQSA